LLLQGRPGIGRTTVAPEAVDALQEADVPVGGFTTGGLRTGGRREGFALPALHTPAVGGVVVVDELGKMELASTAFREAVTKLFGRDVAVVATVHRARHRFTDALKRRPDIQVIRVTEAIPTPWPSGSWAAWSAPTKGGAVTGVSAAGLEEVARAKQAVRKRVWTLLERQRAARFPGAEGRIPNFTGAPAAAARLASLPPWRAARVVKTNPDAPQLPVRARALADGKLLYMAVPRLTDERPFILLDPARLEVPARRAASITGSARAGRRVGVAELRPVDLVVCGSVAVNRQGARVGKGGGFSDLEFALLVEAGLMGRDTVVATTVHPLQVLEEALPETDHDFRLDLIIAGEEVMACRRTRRPPGILWDHLDAAKIAAIPALAARAPGRRHS
jgi:5-formyltetrahydrofolate cyclo-ligase